jgi:hypothetical protein
VVWILVAPLVPPYIMPPASKPRTSQDFHVTPQTDSHTGIQLPHQVPTAATQPNSSLTDHSSTFLPSDPYHHRNHLHPTHQGDFESHVDISVQLQDAKEFQATRSAYHLVKETTSPLPAISPDSSSNDISMTG